MRNNKVDSKWKKRISKHKRYKKFYSWIIKRLALHLLKTSNYLKEEDLIHKELTITYNPEGHDLYPSCHSNLKQWCYSKKKKYIGRFAEYIVFGDTEEEIYLNVIDVILFKQHRYPFC